MKSIIIGLGIQGNKRLKLLSKKELVGTVDPYNKSANFKKIDEVNLKKYDTAFVCVSDDQKRKVIDFLLKNKKNIFIEKPIFFETKYLKKIQLYCKKNKKCFYTAYNHRFEPNIFFAKKLLKKINLGKIYKINGFYGNGTAKNVKNSKWKDYGLGVIPDLGSHLLDTLNYLFKYKETNFKFLFSSNFENNSPDYSIFSNIKKKNIPSIHFTTTYLSWKNSFYFDIYGSKGSLHLNGLCKWGPSYIEHHKRIFPSGKPVIFRKVYKMQDPTWKKEHIFFKKKINKNYNNLSSDLLINRVLKKLNEKK